MKREELKSPVVNEYYGECEWERHPNKYYLKSEADAVMDAMEARIKELEAQLENVQASMYAENVDANMALVKANERIKELEAEVKRWKNDAANCCALLHLVRKGKNPTSTEMIAEADRLEKLEFENARLKDALKDMPQVRAEIESYHIGINTCAETIRNLRDENEQLKAQVPKWHVIADGDLPEEYREYDRFIVCCEVIVDGQKKTYTTEGFLCCGEQPYTFSDNRGYTLKATHWCELIKPTTAEEKK